MSEQLIAKVTHFFGKAQVAALEITEGGLRVGDTIHVVGHTSDFTQRVSSMQIDNAPVEAVKVGDQVGIRVSQHAREHDRVFRVMPD